MRIGLLETGTKRSMLTFNFSPALLMLAFEGTSKQYHPQTKSGCPSPDSRSILLRGGEHVPGGGPRSSCAHSPLCSALANTPHHPAV